MSLLSLWQPLPAELALDFGIPLIEACKQPESTSGNNYIQADCCNYLLTYNGQHLFFFFTSFCHVSSEGIFFYLTIIIYTKEIMFSLALVCLFVSRIAQKTNWLIFTTLMECGWSTGIRGLMRGMATLPQGNQELLVIRDKVGRPRWAWGKQLRGMWYFSFQCLTLLVGWQEGHPTCKKTGCWFVVGDDFTGALHDL